MVLANFQAFLLHSGPHCHGHTTDLNLPQTRNSKPTCIVSTREYCGLREIQLERER